MKTILVADDEQSVRDSLKMTLEYEGFGVLLAENGSQALEKAPDPAVELVLLDIKMSGMDGIEVLQKLKDIRPEMPVVMISGHGTIETAVEATKLGAFDFLPKPLDRDKLLVTVRNAIEHARLSSDVRKLKETIEAGSQIIGSSPQMKEILSLIARVAPTDSRVLITGENGTGKELVARALHRQGKRAQKSLVEVNCAAIPAELIESELFGHEKGSFTGATAQRTGKFEQADGGTLFLDEVGDMSLQAQAKVLRALEEGKIERVGGTKPISVDVRVIAATNKDLAGQIKNGLFREDLFHRLKVIPIHVPPLRERTDDIPELVRYFVTDVCSRNGIPPKEIPDDAMKALQGRAWRGNVRELRNTVERLIILSSGPSIDTALLEPSDSSHQGNDDLLSMKGTFLEFKERAEAAFIRRQLERHKWNISKTAEALDIQRSHLYTKMKRYNLMKNEDTDEADS